MYKTGYDSAKVKSFQSRLWNWKTDREIKYKEFYQFPDEHHKTSYT